MRFVVDKNQLALSNPGRFAVTRSSASLFVGAFGPLLHDPCMKTFELQEKKKHTVTSIFFLYFHSQLLEFISLYILEVSCEWLTYR